MTDFTPFHELLAAAVDIAACSEHPRTEPFHLLLAITEDLQAEEMCDAIDFPYENLVSIVEAQATYYVATDLPEEVDGEKFPISSDFIKIKKRAEELAKEHDQSDIGYIGLLKALREHGDKYSKISLSETVLDLTDADFEKFLKDEKVLQVPYKVRMEEEQKRFEMETGAMEESKKAEESKIKKNFIEAANDNRKILKMADTLKKRVIGQDKAVDTLTQTMKRAFAGLQEANKPVGSYLFAGPTGVGKTEIAQQLAEFLDIKLVRFDMSEYMDEYSAKNLTGSSAGLVGYEQGGLLTNAIAKNPQCVLLLDEMDKAHNSIANVLLQVMDNASLTDSKGKTVDFSNVVLIMTTNAGASDISKAPPSFLQPHANDQVADYNQAIKTSFTPEFRNRLDKVVTFDHLEKGHIKEIAKIFVKEMNKLPAAKNRNISFAVNPTAIKAIVEKSYDKAMGARPVKRFMNDAIKDMIGNIILEKNVKEKKMVICYSPEKDSFHIEQKPLPKSHISKKATAATASPGPEPVSME